MNDPPCMCTLCRPSPPPRAGKALRANITTLGPKVLPLSEVVVFAGNLIGRKVLRLRGLKAYVPDFQEAAQHICIHTGDHAPLPAAR